MAVTALVTSRAKGGPQKLQKLCRKLEDTGAAVSQYSDPVVKYHAKYLVLDGEKVVKEERMLKGALGRIRDVRNGPDGYLYLLTDESSGVMARLEP